MNKKSKLVLLLTLVVFTIIFVSITFSYSTTGSEPQNHKKLNIDTSSNEPLYLIKEYNGKVAIFKYGQSKPYNILDEVYVANLPEYDRSLLKNGIEVFTEEKLYSLIEDLDS